MSTNQVALVLDFEALIQGIENGDSYQRRNFRIRTVLDYITRNYGSVTSKIAFADWSSPRLRKYAGELYRNGFLMIHYVKSIAGKSNLLATLISVKTLDLLARNPRIDTIVINGSDNDLIPLATYIRLSGRTLVYLGMEGMGNSPLATRCDDIAICTPKGIYRNSPASDDDRNNPNNDIVKAIYSLLNVQGLYLDELEDDLMDAMPDFNAETYGYANLLALLEAYPASFRIENTEDGPLVYPIKKTSSYSGRSDGDRRAAQEALRAEQSQLPLKEYMIQTRWFIADGPTREQVLKNIYNVFASEPGLVLKSIDLKNECLEGLEVEDKAWQGTIFSLVCGFCLWEKNEPTDVPLAFRKLALHKSITSLEDFITGYYISLFHKAFSERSDITVDSMLELMHPEDMEGHRALFQQVMDEFTAPAE